MVVGRENAATPGIMAQTPANEPTKSKKEESDEALAFYTLWLMGFTGVLAFATVGLGIATAFLYATGEKQFRVAIRASIKQSRDMRASVAAAENAVRVSREIGEAQVRAYLSCEGATYLVSGSFITCHARFKNNGQSPALWTEVRAHAVTNVRFGSGIGDLNYVRSRPFKNTGPSIAAGQEGEIMILFLHGDLGKGAHEAIWKDCRKFDVRGQVSWLDVFGQTHSQGFFLDQVADNSVVAETERTGEMKSYNPASDKPV